VVLVSLELHVHHTSFHEKHFECIFSVRLSDPIRPAVFIKKMHSVARLCSPKQNAESVTLEQALSGNTSPEPVLSGYSVVLEQKPSGVI
jgi:hypothetical protein